MATLDTTRNYEDGEVLTEADLDAFLDDIETFINVTKISDDNIQNSGITGSTKLLNQSVTEAKLASGSVTAAKLGESAVTTSKIADSNVTTAKIADLNVTTGKINDLAVTTGKLAADAVTGAKIADDAVDTEHIADSAIETDQINDSAVTAAKVNDGAITPAKQSTYYVLGTVATDGTVSHNETKTLDDLTVTGRPVRVLLYAGVVAPGTAPNVAAILQYSSDNSSWSTVETIMATTSDSHSFSLGACAAVHNAPTAGTAYYRLLFSNSGGNASISTAIKFLIEEL